jgi:hypothetical protein
VTRLAHSEDVLVRIEGHDLPGLYCGPVRTIPTVTTMCMSRCNAGQPAELLDLTPGDAFEAMWTLECTAKEGPDCVDVKWCYVQGPVGGRFLYLSWGVLNEGGAFTMFRRAKLWFDGVPPDIVERALSTGVLVGRLGLTDEDGWPLCASVRPPLIEWSAPAQ